MLIISCPVRRCHHKSESERSRTANVNRPTATTTVNTQRVDRKREISPSGRCKTEVEARSVSCCVDILPILQENSKQDLPALLECALIEPARQSGLREECVTAGYYGIMKVVKLENGPVAQMDRAAVS